MSTAPGFFLQPWLGHWVPWLYYSSYWWTVFGFTGNLMFSSRFILQWLASEKNSWCLPTFGISVFGEA